MHYEVNVPYNFMRLSVLLLLLTTVSYCEDVDITSATTTKPIFLNCSDTGDASSNYKWFYKSKLVASANSIQYQITNKMLTGQYNCSKNNISLNSFTVTNLIEPTILHKGHSITFITGDVDKSITCTSPSYPLPDFTWLIKSYGHETINLGTSNNPNYEITTDGNGNSVLRILKVSDLNKGHIYCNIRNIVGNLTTEVLVRVHSNLAPLWPSLAIICEILIVLAVMYVVNKKSTSI
nr:neuroplastin [Ciona intestinalis]|eukprot:XP_009861180.1 neuroplastin [Ciona intestinalis]